MEIIIAASEPATNLAQAVLEGLAEPETSHENARMRIEIQRRQSPAIVRCLVDEAQVPDCAAEQLRRRLAEVLADFVIEHTERRLLFDFLAQEYGHLDEDYETIVETARRLLSGAKADGSSARTTATASDRKEYLLARLQQHLSEADAVNLDGMLKFRLGGYIRQLQAALDRAVEEALLDREHREFIALLKHFVARQDPRIELIHVLFGEHGQFSLLDHQGHQVTESDAAVIEQLGLLDIEVSDVVISALVAIAPRRVLIHEPPHFNLPDLTETLRHVFPNRLYVCKSCRLCRSHGQI